MIAKIFYFCNGFHLFYKYKLKKAGKNSRLFRLHLLYDLFAAHAIFDNDEIIKHTPHKQNNPEAVAQPIGLWIVRVIIQEPDAG